MKIILQLLKLTFFSQKRIQESADNLRTERYQRYIEYKHKPYAREEQETSPFTSQILSYIEKYLPFATTTNIKELQKSIDEILAKLEKEDLNK